MVLSLVGMMGSGKSSVGRELSALLGCPFVDLDSYIEKREGRSIPEIFREEGEAGFRALELSALREVISHQSGSPLVLALGGGTPTNPECAEIISDETLCIYLKASPETLLSHLEGENTASRPMLGGNSLESRLKELLSEREAIYEKTASHTIVTDGQSVKQIAQLIAKEGD